MKKKMVLSVLVVALAVSVVFSFVAISHLLTESGKDTPSASIDISVSDNDGNNDRDTDETESAVSESVKPEPEVPKPEHEEPTPEVELIGGKGGIYHKEIQIFHAEYDESGEITVKSATGDKVVAPGTRNQYDVYVRNVGKAPMSYVLEAQSFLAVTIDGKEVQIPVEASFSGPDNRYLLGAEDALEHLSGLDGVQDSQGLSAGRQAKYTLVWGWPYDGDDEFDTMLGNMAAAGEELTVKVAFTVTAAYDPYAEGGLPMTGEKSTVGLWVALFVISILTLIILLFLGKREQDEENSQTHKENIED